MIEMPAIDLTVHHRPEGMGDRFALGFTRTLRFFADVFLRNVMAIVPSFSKP